MSGVFFFLFLTTFAPSPLKPSTLINVQRRPGADLLPEIDTLHNPFVGQSVPFGKVEASSRTPHDVCVNVFEVCYFTNLLAKLQHSALSAVLNQPTWFSISEKNTWKTKCARFSMALNFADPFLAVNSGYKTGNVTAGAPTNAPHHGTWSLQPLHKLGCETTDLLSTPNKNMHQS